MNRVKFVVNRKLGVSFIRMAIKWNRRDLYMFDEAIKAFCAKQ